MAAMEDCNTWKDTHTHTHTHTHIHKQNWTKTQNFAIIPESNLTLLVANQLCTKTPLITKILWSKLQSEVSQQVKSITIALAPYSLTFPQIH